MERCQLRKRSGKEPSHQMVFRLRRSQHILGAVLYFFVSFFSFGVTAKQRLDGFSPNLHQKTSLRCYSLMVVYRVKIDQGKNWRGGCGGWTPTGKQITPTANTREKARGSGFDPPPLGPIPANAFIMIYFFIIYTAVFS